jgi:hypothetical protein
METRGWLELFGDDAVVEINVDSGLLVQVLHHGVHVDFFLADGVIVRLTDLCDQEVQQNNNQEES